MIVLCVWIGASHRYFEEVEHFDERIPLFVNSVRSEREQNFLNRLNGSQVFDVIVVNAKRTHTDRETMKRLGYSRNSRGGGINVQGLNMATKKNL